MKAVVFLSFLLLGSCKAQEQDAFEEPQFTKEFRMDVVGFLNMGLGHQRLQNLGKILWYSKQNPKTGTLYFRN